MRVISWNVLADAYVRREYFPRTPDALLEPSARRAAVAERAAALDPDVLCLQEVEAPLFEALQRRLTEHVGCWARKGRAKPDGCAVFVRAALGPVTDERLEFEDGTGHVALLVRLPALGVATTHLRWDAPDRPPVGPGQLAAVLDAISDDLPWIVCGDLNAEPGSAVLEVARARGLLDVYAARPDAVTCNANGRRKRIDFLLASPALETTPLPVPVIDDHTPLPSEAEPSDHLPIGALVRSVTDQRSALTGGIECSQADRDGPPRT